jgi:hypothetical protein
VGSELFCQDIHVSIPVCRLAPANAAVSSPSEETKDTLSAAEPMQVFWFPGKPAEDSLELRLLHLLATRGILLEPFERAAIGLREVYRVKDDQTT